jgi:hypothetical protein
MNDIGCVYVEQLMPADDVFMQSKQSNRRIGNAMLATHSRHKTQWKWSAPNPIRLTTTILKIVA